MKKIVVNGTFDVLHLGHLALLNYAKSLGDHLTVAVEIFNSDSELIDIIKKCSIMVKGSDYSGRSVIGQSHCKQVIYFDRIEPYSSTAKIQDIINR